MKLTRLLLFCLVTAVYASNLCAQPSDNFVVIKVGGNVFSSVLNRTVKTGDVVTTKDKLIFQSRGSYLHVINPALGRKTIRNIPDSSPREFMQLLQTFLSVDKKYGNSRGGLAAGIERLVTKFAYDTILILGKGRIAIDTTEVSLRKPSGVKAVYSLKQENVTRVISDDTGFNLGKTYLFDKSMNSPCPKVILWYDEDLKDPLFSPSTLLGTFVPFYPDEEALRYETQAIVETLRGNKLPSSQIVKEVVGYLSAEYASPIPENVKEWLEGSNQLK